MKLWRIAAETRQYRADDLSGGAAARHPGRWNSDKEPVVYCAPAIAIAVLETAAHVDDAGLPLNRYLVEIEVPGAVWAQREEVGAAELAVAWAAIPAGRASIRIGSEWLASLRSPILMLPSVIVPEEWICLINPRHEEAAKIAAKIVRPFDHGRLFRRP